MSDYRQIIRDAQILASSPDEIVRFVEARSKDNLEDSGADLEAKLLAIGNRRIDLALGQHCIFAETAQSLFFRNTEDIPLRLSILSNEKIGSHFRLDKRIPYALFHPESDNLKAYLRNASADELVAIFKNEAIDREFLSDFFEGKSAWNSMDENRRVLSVRLLSQNSGFTAPYKPKEWEWDGSGDYHHGTVFTAAYEMADRVPVSRIWANALTELYAELPIDIHGGQRNLDTARWVASGVEDQEAERIANAEGGFSIFQSVRFFCTLAGLKCDEGRISYLLGSSDIAERSAAYRCGKFPSWKIWWFLRKDGAFAFRQFLQNDHMWESRQKRKIIDRYYTKNSEDLLKCEFHYGEILEERIRKSPHKFHKSELEIYEINLGNLKTKEIELLNIILFLNLIILTVLFFQSRYISAL